jgi:hypothetical protein
MRKFILIFLLLPLFAKSQTDSLKVPMNVTLQVIGTFPHVRDTTVIRDSIYTKDTLTVLVHDTTFINHFDTVYHSDTLRIYSHDTVFTSHSDTVRTFYRDTVFTSHSDTLRTFIRDTVFTTTYITDTTKAEKLLPPNTKTSSYTLALSDAGKLIELNSNSANTVTIPNDSSVNFPIGSQTVIVQYGTGVTTIVAASGVTIHGTLTLTQYRGVILYKQAANEYIFFNQ